MKLMRTLSFIVLGLVAMTGVLFYTGCEDKPSDDNVEDYFDNNAYSSADRDNNISLPLSISPASAQAKAGQQVGYGAAGGSAPYSWSVGTAANGSIAAANDSAYAIYTHLGGTNDVNSVIVSDSGGAVTLSNVN